MRSNQRMADAGAPAPTDDIPIPNFVSRIGKGGAIQDSTIPGSAYLTVGATVQCVVQPSAEQGVDDHAAIQPMRAITTAQEVVAVLTMHTFSFRSRS